jgi:hypothetical protein
MGPATMPEIVHRPDPGLARGVWETSPSFFYIVLGVVVVLASVYLAFRLGVFRRAKVPPGAGRPR